MDWKLINYYTGLVVSAVGGVVSGLDPNQAMLDLPLDLTGVQDGTYQLVGTISYFAPGIGNLTDELFAWTQFDVHNQPADLVFTGPASVLFPATDGYRDQVSVIARNSPQPLRLIRLHGRSGRLRRSDRSDAAFPLCLSGTGLDLEWQGQRWPHRPRGHLLLDGPSNRFRRPSLNRRALQRRGEAGTVRAENDESNRECHRLRR